jgi:hypothetical protein
MLRSKTHQNSHNFQQACNSSSSTVLTLQMPPQLGYNQVSMVEDTLEELLLHRKAFVTFNY